MEAKGPPSPAHESRGDAWFRLLDEHEPLHTLFEDLGAVATEIDRNGRILRATRTAEAVFGYPASELIGVHGLDLVHPHDHSQLPGPRSNGGGGQDVGRVYRIRHKRGHWVWLETIWQSPPEEAKHSKRLLVFTRDVTPLKAARDALKRTEERYRTVVESTNDVVIEMDATGRVVFASPNLRQALGYSPDEVRDESALAFVHPNDATRLARAFEDARASPLPTRFDAYRVQHADGRWLWFQSTGMPYRHRSEQTRFLTVGRDITSVVAQARERMTFESRIAQTKRLESFGVMAGGVAHDFNNLLVPLLMETTLAISDLPADDPTLIRLERVQRAVRKASAITNQMLSYAGSGDFAPTPLDLSQLIRRTAPTLTSAAGRRASVTWELAPELPRILGDSQSLLNALNHLVTNAVEALEPDEGTIVVRTGTTRPPDTLDVEFPGQPPSGDCVFLEVEDNGSGMDPPTREQSFDPFFTTRFTGRGLGLAAVLGVVRAHSAAIELDSSPGRGTRIRILLPTPGEGEAPVDAPRALDKGSDGGKGRVLVIEDDLGTREIIEEILSGDGYPVVTAKDGTGGIRALEEHGDDIALVILDFTLPGEHSPSVFERLRAIHPNVPVLLMSGYNQRRATTPFPGESLSGFLHKPFLPEQLLETTRQLVPESPGPEPPSDE